MFIMVQPIINFPFIPYFGTAGNPNTRHFLVHIIGHNSGCCAEYSNTDIGKSYCICIFNLLNIHEKKGRSLGWCRGYQELQSYNYVGFSRIRPTKFMENIKWLGNKITDKVKLKMQNTL